MLRKVQNIIPITNVFTFFWVTKQSFLLHIVHIGWPPILVGQRLRVYLGCETFSTKSGTVLGKLRQLLMPTASFANVEQLWGQCDCVNMIKKLSVVLLGLKNTYSYKRWEIRENMIRRGWQGLAAVNLHLIGKWFNHPSSGQCHSG